MAVINWNTVPDYDEWGWDTSWSCTDWINWHKSLSKHFGQSTATEIWNYAFEKSTNLSSNLDCNALDTEFRKYVKAYGLKPNNDIITQVLGTSSDVLTGAIDTTSNVTSGAFGLINSVAGGSNLKRTINIALIVGGVIGIVYVYKTFKK